MDSRQLLLGFRTIQDLTSTAFPGLPKSAVMLAVEYLMQACSHSCIKARYAIAIADRR